jgi:hypothetical protein
MTIASHVSGFANAGVGSISFPETINGTTTNGFINSIVVNSSGLFVAVGYESSTSYPLYATSSNGTVWTTPARMNSSTTYARMNGVTVNSSGLFVAVGYDSIGAPLYATSSDGSSWSTPARMNGSSAAAYMRAIEVNSSGQFVAIGSDDNISSFAHGIYATSSNGSTWTTPARFNGSATIAAFFTLSVNSSGLFVAGGTNSTGKQLTSVSSNGGSTWTTPALIFGSGSGGFYTTFVKSGNFIGVGYYSSNTICYASSSDGITWAAPTTISLSFDFFTNGSVVSPSGLIIVVGYNSSTTKSYYMTSSNGSTWSSLSSIDTSTGTSLLSHVAVNSSGLFVLVGQTSSPIPSYAYGNLS